jgi:hypothetical protein
MANMTTMGGIGTSESSVDPRTIVDIDRVTNVADALVVLGLGTDVQKLSRQRRGDAYRAAHLDLSAVFDPTTLSTGNKKYYELVEQAYKLLTLINKPEIKTYRQACRELGLDAQALLKSLPGQRRLDIRSAFMKICKSCHPDTFPNNISSEVEFKRANDAHQLFQSNKDRLVEWASEKSMLEVLKAQKIVRAWLVAASVAAGVFVTAALGIGGLYYSIQPNQQDAAVGAHDNNTARLVVESSKVGSAASQLSLTREAVQAELGNDVGFAVGPRSAVSEAGRGFAGNQVREARKDQGQKLAFDVGATQFSPLSPEAQALAYDEFRANVIWAELLFGDPAKINKKAGVVELGPQEVVKDYKSNLTEIDLSEPAGISVLFDKSAMVGSGQFQLNVSQALEDSSRLDQLFASAAEILNRREFTESNGADTRNMLNVGTSLGGNQYNLMRPNGIDDNVAKRDGGIPIMVTFAKFRFG